jgi:eukaryotic-like serine/threonine-protein kinase
MSEPGAPRGVICSRCRSANAAGARFCGVCGAVMEMTEPAPGPGPAPAPVSQDRMIGREIAGRYRVLAKLGEGGMGTVFRAEQISLKRTVAVKLLRPDVSADPLLLRRFNAEAELVAKLSHPNTVNIYDFGQDRDGTLFIAMELIDGRSLRQAIQREAPMPLPRALAIGAQIAASLADAHAHAIIHRDLKPDNVMLQDRGRERDVVRVLDFGIAKLRDDTRATHAAMTQQGDMVGTPQYMAPEQIRGDPIDGRTDIYALGCLLYEMATARLPHEAQTVLAMLSKHLTEQPQPPSQRRPDLGIPAAVDALILGAMAKDPRARAPAMEAFGEQIAALRQHLGFEPGSAQRSAAVPAMPGPDAVRIDTPYPGPPSHAMAPASPPGAPSPPGHAPWPALAPAAASAAVPTPVMSPASAMPAGLPVGATNRKAAVIAIAGVLAAGAGIGALAFANRGRSPVAPTPAPIAHAEPPATVAAVAPPPDAAPPQAAVPAPAVVEPPSPSPAPAPPSPAPPPPSPAPRSPPPAPPPPVTRRPSVARSPGPAPVAPAKPPGPAPVAPAKLPDGQKLSIGGGVQLIVPPGFQISVKNHKVVGVNASGVRIIGGPFVGTGSDPKELAQDYARITHHVLGTITALPVSGVSRPSAAFHGTVSGVQIGEIVVFLVSPKHPILVIFQFPMSLAKDPTVLQIGADLFAKRIIVP